VQNPNARRNLPGPRMVQDILRRAAECVERCDIYFFGTATDGRCRTSAARAAQPLAEQPRSSMFRGSGNTLGSDEVESTFVPDPNAQQGGHYGVSRAKLTLIYLEVEAEAAQRNITFWRNGFSIEGGEFYAYANPENEQLLEEINTG
jgi:UBX domain-containing protein 1